MTLRIEIRARYAPDAVIDPGRPLGSAMRIDAASALTQFRRRFALAAHRHADLCEFDLCQLALSQWHDELMRAAYVP